MLSPITQGRGFAAQYLASSTPQVNIPVCTGGAKLLQVVLRTRAYGSEISWVVGKRSLLNVVFASTPNEQNIVMTGALVLLVRRCLMFSMVQGPGREVPQSLCCLLVDRQVSAPAPA